MPTQARAAIEPLQRYSFFDAVESGGQISFRLRDKAASATLTSEELAAHENGSARPTSLKIARVQDADLPKTVRLHYSQFTRDYEAGQQSFARQTTGAVNALDMELAISMDDDKAAQISEVTLTEAWANRERHEFACSAEKNDIEPGDVVDVVIDGTTYTIRLLEKEYAAPGLIAFRGVRHDQSAYSSDAEGAPGATPDQTLDIKGPTILILLDLPMLMESHNDAGYYAAVRGITDGWSSAAIFRSSDGGASYQNVEAVSGEDAIGAANDALPAGSTEVWDEGNTLEVTMNSGELSSAADSAVLAGANAFALEVRDEDGVRLGWEVAQFADAFLSSDETYELSRLLRGRLGTEWAVGLHQEGDLFVMLRDLARIESPLSAIGQDRPHRAVTSGTALSDAAVVDFVPQGIALEPYSPVHLQGFRDASGNLTITWIRRTRITTAWLDGADAPLGEASESYEVDIMSTGDSYIRTISVTAQTASYTAAQQVTDFGAVQSSIRIRVYQLSATVGRGYAAEGIV